MSAMSANGVPPFENRKVSTIIPVFNRPGMLREAVESVLKQDYRPIEIIIVDDGSTDETPAVIEELCSKHSDVIRSLRTSNAGPGAAREAGRAIADGEFIQYLDSDDLLLPGKFSGQIALLDQKVDCDVSYGKTAFQVIGNDLQLIPYKGTGSLVSSMFPTLLASRWWSTSSPLYRRSVCDRAGPWLPLINEEDWEYECRIASLGTKLAYFEDFVSVTRSHTEGHACSDGASDSIKLRDRCVARMKIIEHGLKGGVDPDHLDFQSLLRSSFLLARQAGSHRVQEATQLFELIAGLDTRFTIRLFAMMSRILGFKLAADWSEKAYTMLSKQS